MGMQIGAATMEVPQKVKNSELPCDPAIPLLSISLKNLKTFIHKNICAPMFTASLFPTVKSWKQPKCPLMDD